MDKYSFGYPKQCTKCGKGDFMLQVEPFLKNGERIRLMLVGQDPTIFKKPERVKSVLMLDQENSQLSRWLKDLFGSNNFQSLTLYATNLIKCSFNKPPSTTQEGGLNFLMPYFKNCMEYLKDEVCKFKPNLLLTLGEPAHKLFITILDNHDSIGKSMQSAFKGYFLKVKLEEVEFDYSPCLHIKTFRVAKVYGDSVKQFKKGIENYFK
ncbi:MAG: hypothetical protein HZB79_02300 [Deltaproteobacteria bacterium]|nr:hypothetical protein [Deltaproteobacteria bacterium]